MSYDVPEIGFSLLCYPELFCWMDHSIICIIGATDFQGRWLVDNHFQDKLIPVGLGRSSVFTVWVVMGYLSSIHLCSRISFQPGCVALHHPPLHGPPSGKIKYKAKEILSHTQEQGTIWSRSRDDAVCLGHFSRSCKRSWVVQTTLSDPRRERWTGVRLRVRLGVEHPLESSKCCALIPVCTAA